MSHRPFSRDNDGFRPWKRNDDAPRPAGGERAPGGAPGETDSKGNYRTDNVWRSDTAHRAVENDGRPPFVRRDDAPRGGGDRGGGFERRPWQSRDDAPRGGGDRGGGDRGGGFERRPWQSRDEAPRGGGDRGGFGRPPFVRRDDAPHAGGDRGGAPERRPWQSRDEAPRGGGDRGGGFERRPWQSRDEAPRGGEKPAFTRFDPPRGGDRGGGGFERRPWQNRDDAPRGGGDRGAPERRPWQSRDDAPRGGGDRGGFEPRPWQRRDDDRPARAEAPSDRGAPKARFPEAPQGELIYGRQPILELLRAGRRNVRELILADGVKSSDEITAIEALCLERSIAIRRFDRETLDAWLNAANHQGAIAVCDEFPYVDFEEILEAVQAAEGNALVVLLDHVVDPQNLGSLLRSCEAAGALGVVLPADRAVAVTPAAVRASAGAAEHLRISIVPNLITVMEKLKGLKDVPVWTTGLEGIPEAKPYTEVDFKGKVALVIGSEGQGLGRLVREHCDFLARLPMCGKVGSLNAGVAGALAMYEVLRQHGRK